MPGCWRLQSSLGLPLCSSRRPQSPPWNPGARRRCGRPPCHVRRRHWHAALAASASAVRCGLVSQRPDWRLHADALALFYQCYETSPCFFRHHPVPSAAVEEVRRKLALLPPEAAVADVAPTWLAGWDAATVVELLRQLDSPTTAARWGGPKRCLAPDLRLREEAADFFWLPFCRLATTMKRCTPRGRGQWPSCGRLLTCHPPCMLPGTPHCCAGRFSCLTGCAASCPTARWHTSAPPLPMLP